VAAHTGGELERCGAEAACPLSSNFAPAGAAGATVRFTSGDKSIDADATHDYGTCPASSPPPYCGDNSNVMPTPSYQSGEPVVVAGTTVDASCQTQGNSINNQQSSDPNYISSGTWIHVPGYGG
jgi:hypothetical protein